MSYHCTITNVHFPFKHFQPTLWLESVKGTSKYVCYGA
uniref:Uncharacterized protein n=1 Tax=Arundo donax TaxID=35708 RepID=A0A0A9B5E8_ARUDO